MDELSRRILTRLAVAVMVLSTGWIIFEALRTDPAPGEVAHKAADRAFADGHYERALRNYRDALESDPDRLDAIRGKARTLLQQERYAEAITWFDEATRRSPDFAGTYANRGIAYDRMGRHEQALADYEYAIRLDEEVAKGPGWITRLLHMNEAPPTVKDRAEYLRAQLTLPEEKRVLNQPDEDKSQRTYRQRP